MYCKRKVSKATLAQDEILAIKIRKGRCCRKKRPVSKGETRKKGDRNDKLCKYFDLIKYAGSYL